jgi:hypothetical protein
MNNLIVLGMASTETTATTFTPTCLFDGVIDWMGHRLFDYDDGGICS